MATPPETRRPRSEARIDRRGFIKAAGGTAAVAAGVAPFQQSRAAAKRHWDHEADVVVVGSGAAGLSAAITATSQGAKVIVLEAAPIAGGTTARSGGGFWIPNNRFMRARGQVDARDDAIRYMARFSATQLYNPADPFLGLPENAYRVIASFYDNAAPSIERLEALGALKVFGDVTKYHGQDEVDYWDYAPENKTPTGRCIFAGRKDTEGAAGGAGMIEQLLAWLEKNRCRCFSSTVPSDSSRTARTRSSVSRPRPTRAPRSLPSEPVRPCTSAAAASCTTPDLKLNFQRAPVFGGCSPLTNQGDFVYMATALGARLGNMQNGWRIQLVLDQVLTTPSLTADMWHNPGDSAFTVNKYGKRVGDEKINYNDRCEAHCVYDPTRQEWAHLVLFYIFDSRTRELAAGQFPIPAKDANAPHILTGNTLEELSAAIRHAPGEIRATDRRVQARSRLYGESQRDHGPVQWLCGLRR